MAARSGAEKNSINYTPKVPRSGAEKKLELEKTYKKNEFHFTTFMTPPEFILPEK